MPDESPDRYHNREEDSPESLRRSIDALADAVSALDRKLDGVALDLGTDIDGARGVTRHLAKDVALMGEALVRRIESAVPVAVRTPPRRPRLVLWIVGVALLIAVAAAAIWSTSRQVERPRIMPSRVVTIPPPQSPSPPPVTAPAPKPPADVGPQMHHTPWTGAGHRRRTHYPWSPRAMEPPPVAPLEPS